MKLWMILVPVQFNDGTPIEPEYQEQWEARVRHIAGGLTKFGVAEGHWLAPDGRLCIEPMQAIMIACGEEEIKTISDYTARWFEQNAVMRWLVSSQVVIDHYKQKEAAA